MVRQFRHGVSACTLEIPGGMVDSGDASPAVAARREMVEESGFDVVRRQVPTFDATEGTEIVLVPLASVPALVRGGQITHALVVVAFHWLVLRRE